MIAANHRWVPRSRRAVLLTKEGGKREMGKKTLSWTQRGW
jgi:hypothetical protein